MKKLKSYAAVLVIQLFYPGMHILSKAALNDGMRPYILVFYRQAAAAVFLAPLAFFLEWKTARPLTLVTFTKFFFISLFGITLSWNLLYVALGYTSAPLSAAAANTIPVITFFLAVVFRLESLNLRTMSGISKAAGIALCLGGAATIAFFSGSPYLRLLVHHHLINNYGQQTGRASSGATWVKGVFLMLLSLTFWSSWLVLQGVIIKSYPSKLLCTTLQNFLSSIQSFIIAIALERDPHQWKLGWDVRLLTVGYCGILVSGIAVYLQAWVIEYKGPVYQAMWSPLCLILTICFSAILFGEIISLGSVLGAILLVLGLYCVLWGKTKEQTMEKEKCASITHTQQKYTTSKDEIQQGSSPKQFVVENSCSCV